MTTTWSWREAMTMAPERGLKRMAVIKGEEEIAWGRVGEKK